LSKPSPYESSKLYTSVVLPSRANSKFTYNILDCLFETPPRKEDKFEDSESTFQVDSTDNIAIKGRCNESTASDTKNRNENYFIQDISL